MFNKQLSLFVVKTKVIFSNALGVTLLILSYFTVFSGQAHAITVDWSYTNSNIVTEADSVSQTVDGITVTAQAFTAEITGPSSATIYGPFPTTAGYGNLQVFGTNTSGLHNPGLGLLSQPIDGIDVTGTDFGGGNYRPGIDNNQFVLSSTSGPALPSFEYVVFSFSSPITLNQVEVDGITNYDRSIWAASGTTLPGTSGDFLSAFAGLAIANSFDNAANGPFTHDITGATDITYLAIGALPSAPFGPLAGRVNDNFYITGLDFVPGGAPPATSVPEPSTWALMALGFLGLASVGARRTWRRLRR